MNRVVKARGSASTHQRREEKDLGQNPGRGIWKGVGGFDAIFAAIRFLFSLVIYSCFIHTPGFGAGRGRDSG